MFGKKDTFVYEFEHRTPDKEEAEKLLSGMICEKIPSELTLKKNETYSTVEKVNGEFCSVSRMVDLYTVTCRIGDKEARRFIVDGWCNLKSKMLAEIRDDKEDMDRKLEELKKLQEKERKSKKD